MLGEFRQVCTFSLAVPNEMAAEFAHLADRRCRRPLQAIQGEGQNCRKEKFNLQVKEDVRSSAWLIAAGCTARSLTACAADSGNRTNGKPRR